VFQEFDSDSAAMIVLEGDKPLGADRTTTTTAWFTSSPRTPSTWSTFRISGGSADGGRFQSTDGKAALVQCISR